MGTGKRPCIRGYLSYTGRCPASLANRAKCRTHLRVSYRLDIGVLNAKTRRVVIFEVPAPVPNPRTWSNLLDEPLAVFGFTRINDNPPGTVVGFSEYKNRFDAIDIFPGFSQFIGDGYFFPRAIGGNDRENRTINCPKLLDTIRYRKKLHAEIRVGVERGGRRSFFFYTKTLSSGRNRRKKPRRRPVYLGRRGRGGLAVNTFFVPKGSRKARRRVVVADGISRLTGRP